MWFYHHASQMARISKTLITALFSFILILSLHTTAQGQSTLPDVNVKTLEGQSVNIKDQLQEGEVTVISFWATWCAPCKLELDAITEIYEDWRADYEVSLIAVSVDDARASAKVGPMVAEKGWPFLVLADNNQELMRQLSFQSIPYTILVDQQGQIVYTHTGYLPGDEEDLEAEIEALMQ